MFFNRLLVKIFVFTFLGFLPAIQQAHSLDQQEKICKEADLLIFSYDRPLQLKAYLESLQKYVTGIKGTSVIYRTSSNDFEKAYQKLKTFFPSVFFIKQEDDPHQNFKPLLLKAAFETMQSSYLLFGTLFLMLYILKITAEYFSDSLGWAFSLVIAGFGLILIGYIAFEIHKKYLGKKAE